MATGEVVGYGGSITCADLNAGVKAWSLDIVADALGTTDYGDSGERTYIVGLTGWSGSCEVNWDENNMSLVVGAEISTLTFTVKSGKTYSGQAFVTGISVSSPVDGLVTMTVTFQGSSTLSYPS